MRVFSGCSVLKGYTSYLTSLLDSKEKGGPWRRRNKHMWLIRPLPEEDVLLAMAWRSLLPRSVSWWHFITSWWRQVQPLGDAQSWWQSASDWGWCPHMRSRKARLAPVPHEDSHRAAIYEQTPNLLTLSPWTSQCLFLFISHTVYAHYHVTESPNYSVIELFILYWKIN